MSAETTGTRRVVALKNGRGQTGWTETERDKREGGIQAGTSIFKNGNQR